MMNSLYFHIPFCKQRCHYCDFFTTTGTEDLISDYMMGIIREVCITTDGREFDPVHSIYFGGGTPSLIPAESYEKLIFMLSKIFKILPNCEISLEANPGTLSRDYLKDLKGIGFNRLSLGVQSTDSFDLLRLDRIHDIEAILCSVTNARLAGFKNVSFDLIFGLPWQDLRSWENTLQRAIMLNPQHLSVYSLIIEPGTPLFSWHKRGLIAEKDQDLEAEMYELAISQLDEAGFEHYEISNWRQQNPDRDFRCRHNLQYWRNQAYFGFGAGAHGYVDGVRTENISNLQLYIEKMKHAKSRETIFPGSPATIFMDVVESDVKMRDFLLLGLRLIQEGVSMQSFKNLYGVSMKIEFSHEISFLLKNKLVEWENGDQDRLRLTNRGVMVANQVFMQFV
jgi:oxygen-independent coproporphyrinogen III oxidase